MAETFRHWGKVLPFPTKYLEFIGQIFGWPTDACVWSIIAFPFASQVCVFGGVLAVLPAFAVAFLRLLKANARFGESGDPNTVVNSCTTQVAARGGSALRPSPLPIEEPHSLKIPSLLISSVLFGFVLTGLRKEPCYALLWLSQNIDATKLGAGSFRYRDNQFPGVPVGIVKRLEYKTYLYTKNQRFVYACPLDSTHYLFIHITLVAPRRFKIFHILRVYIVYITYYM